MSMRRTQAVSLKSGETVNVLPREIPGLKAAGLLSKDTKARKAAKVTPRTDEKAAIARKLIEDRINANEAKEAAKAAVAESNLITKVYAALNAGDHAEAAKLAADIKDEKVRDTALNDAEKVKKLADKEAEKDKDQKDPGKTKEEKGTGGTKEVPSGAITTGNVNQ